MNKWRNFQIERIFIRGIGTGGRKFPLEQGGAGMGDMIPDPNPPHCHLWESMPMLVANSIREPIYKSCHIHFEVKAKHWGLQVNET